jgi:hypothetical protein
VSEPIYRLDGASPPRTDRKEAMLLAAEAIDADDWQEER